MLEKKWTHTNIPHFKPVIEGVSDKEGIEISLSCNLNAFEWIISHLRKLDPNFIEKGQKEGEKQELLEEAPLDGLNEQNVMNIL